MTSQQKFRTSALLVAGVALTALTLTACSNSEQASTLTSSAKPTPTTDSTVVSAGEAVDQAELDGKTFNATDVTGHTLVEGSELTIAFEKDRIAVRAGCNNMNGGYTIDGDTLEAPMLASTMMACEPELMAQDQWISEFLAAAPTAELNGETLTLTSDDTTIELTQN